MLRTRHAVEMERGMHMIKATSAWGKAFVLVVALSLTGCGSVMNLLCDNKVYGGVANDLNDLSSETAGYKALTVVDLPLSFVVDTVTLPYTLPSHYLFDVGRTCRFASF